MLSLFTPKKLKVIPQPVILLIMHDDNTKTENIGNILKIYTSWKAQNPLPPEQHQLVELKLTAKYKPKTKHTEESATTSSQPKQEIHKVMFKSKELIPHGQHFQIQEEIRVGRREQQNMRLFARKNSSRHPLNRFQSVDCCSKEQSPTNKVIKLNFTRTMRSHTTSAFKQKRVPIKSSPAITHKQFRLKKQPKTVRTISPEQSPRSKVQSLERFCSSSKKQKNNFLKGMIIGDLHVLKHKCQVDMDEFIIKLKKQQRLRKARAINCWRHFNYNEIFD